MDEERLRVLQMLKEGKITAEEAVGLLEAMDCPLMWRSQMCLRHLPNGSGLE